MDPLVQKYLKTKLLEQEAAKREKQRDLLVELGLYRKEYSTNKDRSDEYPEWELDAKTGEGRWYKKVPVPVTDEEYAAILKLQDQDDDETEQNPVSVALKAIAWILFIGGGIAGIVLGIEADAFSLFLGYWFASFASGMIFLALSEIIRLLGKRKKK